MNSVLKHLGVFLFFFILIFIINKVPEGYFISGGDFHQLININDSIDQYLYSWFELSGKGQYNPLLTTYPFYFIQKVLFNIGLSYSQISNFIMFQFLIGSFYSFFFAQKLLFKKLNTEFIGPFGYSLNLFTLGVLFYPYIITHHFLIYIFIPLLLGTFTKYILSKETVNKYLFYFLIIFILSLPAYNNIAFLFTLFLAQGMIWFFYLFFNKPSKKLFSQFIIAIVLQLLLSIIVISPFLSSQYGYKQYAIESKALGGDAIKGMLSSTPGTPLNSLRLVIDKYRFPNIEKNVRFQQIPTFFVTLAHVASLIFILSILYFLITNKQSHQKKKLFYTFLFTYLALLLFSFRLTEPFQHINLLFYRDLTLGILRSSDKIFSFLPFFTVCLFIYSINKISLNKKVLYGLYVCLILPVSFIFLGGIIKQYLFDINNYKQGIVKIPTEYINIQKIINSDNDLNGIISIPYSVVNSIGWSNYPKWGYKGIDLLYLLYNRRYISANSYDHITVNTASLKKFSSHSATLEELTYLIQKFGAKYIMNHKDVEKRYLGLTDKNIKLLLDNNIITIIERNNFFDLYEVNSNLINPLIGGGLMNFTKINPTQYNVTLSIHSNKSINFLQSHNPQWKLFLNSYDISKKCVTKKQYIEVTECLDETAFFEGDELSYLYKNSLALDKHKMIYDYANSWDISSDDIIKYVNDNYKNELVKEGYPKIIENGKTDYKYYIVNKDGSIDVQLTLYFKPQSYFYLGLLISGSGLLILLGGLLILRIRKINKKIN